MTNIETRQATQCGWSTDDYKHTNSIVLVNTPKGHKWVKMKLLGFGSMWRGLPGDRLQRERERDPWSRMRWDKPCKYRWRFVYLERRGLLLILYWWLYTPRIFVETVTISVQCIPGCDADFIRMIVVVTRWICLKHCLKGS